MTQPTLSRTPGDGEHGVAPRIALPRRGASGFVLGFCAIAAALLLFGVLDARRRSLTAPAVQAPGRRTALSEAPPPLYIPPEFPVETTFLPPVPDYAPFMPPVVPSRPGRAYQPVPQQDFAPEQPERAERNPRGATLIMDTSQQRPADEQGQANGAPATSSDINNTAGRVRAGAMASRSTTVPQGALIPAVLETGFNSSRPGFARALVQRDVRGFDGTRILIPRGSRLIGEYGSDAKPGQNRALVNWTRLIRPDGVTIAIASPTTDPVGRGGVKAQVNSHFMERFAGAFLQSALDLGVNLAASSSRSPVFVALPDAMQGASSATRPTEIPPTLKVRQGTSINVFVARDLDFTDVESAR